MLGGKVLGNSTPKRIVKLLLEVIRKKLTTQPVLRPSLSWDTYIKVSKRVFITSSMTDIPTSITMKVSPPSSTVNVSLKLNLTKFYFYN